MKGRGFNLILVAKHLFVVILVRKIFHKCRAIYV